MLYKYQYIGKLQGCHAPSSATISLPLDWMLDSWSPAEGATDAAVPEAAVLPEELEQPDRVSTPAAAMMLIREIKVLRFIVGFPFLYKNICEIGKERIRRAGQKIRNEQLGIKNEGDNSSLQTPNSSLDTGFRVLKCDTSNMKDVYYNPAEYEPSLFSSLEDNIKEDRTPEDLLFQVMLDLGILLSSKIQVRSEKVGMRNYSYFDVEDGYLIACFDKNIDEEVITAIAKQKPYYFVMRDSSMATDSVATNFEQIFAAYSPDTVRKVL